MDLVKFLLARINEDEADAMVGWRWKALDAGEYARLQSRVLAECDAKRRIAGAAKRADENAEHTGDPYTHAEADTWRDAVQLLALPYADHPDYNPEWKP